MLNLRLGTQIFTMEIRKIFAYRIDFWLSFIVSTGAQFLVAWFLWRSIFMYRAVDTIGPFTFPSLMLYYLLVPIIGRTVYGGAMGEVAMEIYQGTLTRYLVYPVSFFRYKLIVHCANASILLLQLLLVTTVVSLFLPSFTTSYRISFSSIGAGCATIFLSTLLFFLFSSTIQLVAFWADHVWSLSAILRFITGLLGGSLIPLALFPEDLQPLLTLLPFSGFIHLPIRTFLGMVTAQEWIRGVTVMLFWGTISALVYTQLWYRGNRHYGGVGI